MKTLWILRGISGSGKTGTAEQLLQLPHAVAFSTDDYFTDPNGENYTFDVTKLGTAHNWCRTEVARSMYQGTPNIIVHNTNTSEKEIQPYLNSAAQYEYKVISLIVENRHGNKDVHGVPEETLLRQERKLINSIKLR